MFQAKKISLAVSAALSSGLIGLAPSALAQSTGTQALERVEITGSLLRRIEGETALPTTTLSTDEIVKAGATNAEQAMSLVTQNQSGTVTSGSVSGTNGGAAYASLRNLGANRTLVLLNGKRVVQNPFATAGVDLNTLPTAALDRIEILSDGASSTYGTDAIAGVVNFITRKEYKGLTVGGEAQFPEEGGGEVYVANVLGGWGTLAKDGWNVFGGFNYRKQEPMLGTERDFSRTSFIPDRGFNGTSPTTFPANYSQTVGTTTITTNPSLPGCQPPLSIQTGPGPLGLGTNRCGADTQGFTQTVPDQEQWSAFLRGSLALGKDHTAYAEYFFANNTLKTQIAPSPESGFVMGPDSPFYPGKGITPITDPRLDPTRTISINWRTTAIGPRQTEQSNDTQRIVLGLEGVIVGWDYQAAYNWSNSQTTNVFTSGWPKTSALSSGVRGTSGAPYLNPFGDQSAAGLAYLQANQVLGEMQNGESTLQSLTAVASRQFGSLPGGPMSIGLGAEFRKEDMVYNTNAAVREAASSGLAGSGLLRQGDRDIWAIGLEMAFPVLKNLEIGASVRYDDYSDFGGTTNPKISVKYTPVQNLLLRGSYNTGFAAPSLYNLYLPNSTTFTGGRYNDPVLCPNGVVNTAAGGVATRDCGIQFQQLQGGNADLQPEESSAWTIGFVFQPTPQVSFGVDYWDYTITTNISTIGENAIFADTNKYANLFVRCSQAPAELKATVPGCRQVPPGDPLAYIINTFLNLGDTKTTGFDFQFNWNPTATEYGRFSLNWRGTYVTKYEFQIEPGGVWYNPVGNYNAQFQGPVQRFRQVLNLGWEYGAWNANLIYNFSSGYKDQNSGIAAPYNDNSVGNYDIFNLAVGYKGIKGLTLGLGVLNLLDTDPPFSNQTRRFQARGYDDRFHNPLGRTWTIGAKYEFL